VEQRFVGEGPFIGSTKDLIFSGRIFLYSRVGLQETDIKALHTRANELRISVIFRGPQYAEERSIIEKPQAFICSIGLPVTNKTLHTVNGYFVTA
jgi:hypothetical protein